MADQNASEPPPSSCPPPPLDHLRPTGSAPIALPTGADRNLYDRKTGNPGPPVRPYGESTSASLNPEQAIDLPDVGQPEEPYKEPDDDDDFQEGGMDAFEEVKKPEPPPKDEQFSPEQEEKIRETLEDLKLIFPLLKEEWLRRSIIQVMIKDTWNIDQTINWLYDYENLAPRKEQLIADSAALIQVDDYATARKMLRSMKHEVTANYEYFAEVKLTQKFPQFSIYSLRQVLQDCDYMYPMAVLNIMEGLELALKHDKRTWKEWKKHELIWIVMEKASDGKRYKYPMCVVKGEKFWCKKKAKMMEFPSLLGREVRLVEKALIAYERRFVHLKEKLEAEMAKKERLKDAIAAGISLECPICMNDYLVEEQVSCTAGHIFCLGCLQGAVKEAATGNLQLSSQGELPCISSKCQGIFPMGMLCHMLPPESLAMFEERIWVDFLAKSGIANLTKCPECGYAEVVEESPEILKLFQCKNPRCGHQSCRNCGSPWKEHVGKGCKEMQVDPEKALRKKYDDIMTEVFIRRCLRCKRPQYKDEGCNKLTCQCGAKMCYLCRKPIEDYAHFCQHPTIESGMCPCGKCKLFADPEQVDNKLRENLQQQLQAELMELKMKQEGASKALVSKLEGSQSAPLPTTTAEAPAPPIPPQQRQFAAIFGGP